MMAITVLTTTDDNNSVQSDDGNDVKNKIHIN